MHRFPVDGAYSFRLVFNGHRPNQSMPAHGAVWIDGKTDPGNGSGCDRSGRPGPRIPRQGHGGRTPGLLSYLKEYHGLPPSYGGPEPSTRPPVPLISARGKLTEKDIETLRKLGTTIKTDSIETRIDNRFESIDIGGPFDQVDGTFAPESLRRIFVCDQQTAGAARAPSCANFAARAFRRPAAAEGNRTVSKLYALARKQGDSFEEGIAAALEGVLVSPEFSLSHRA